ncbi:sterol desaturase family protein [Oecophyllibacter saccharovorans]|uniref:sterol desaturase family protein n=1 Tax=Oecophyllibacter saccharovorans TaxID=2558360 RepID=UPI0011710347|nr:sterol desaturase family protein [Oecophyllibacter saccharovorans]TPW36532.1 fatty acid hydroxylase [Oecophyllibacter saccharovorans]
MTRFAPGGRKYRTDPPIRIFQNRFLESFTLTPFRVFFACWLVILCLAFWLAGTQALSLPSLVLWSVVGFLIWFPCEYVVHRYPFHWQPNHPALSRLVYVIHGNHHIQPNHPLRTLMPVVVSLPIGLGLLALFTALLGSARGCSLWAGFLLGYVVYDTVHYACHNWPMRRGIARWVRRHHMLHHYRNEDTNYQISFPPIDYVMRSQFRRTVSVTHTVRRQKVQSQLIGTPPAPQSKIKPKSQMQLKRRPQKVEPGVIQESKAGF